MQRYSNSFMFSALAMTLILAGTLTACGGSAKLDSRPVTELKHAAPPEALTEPCDDPYELPNGAMSAGAALRAAAHDRAALVSCKGKHKGLIDYDASLRDGLSSKN